MIRGFFVGDFKYAHRDNIQIVDHHIELTCFVLSQLVLLAISFKCQVVQLESHVAANSVQSSLIVHLSSLPQALRPVHCLVLCKVNFRVERLRLVFECLQNGVLLVYDLKVFTRTRADLPRCAALTSWIDEGWGVRAGRLENPLGQLSLRVRNALPHCGEILLNLLEVILDVLEGIHWVSRWCRICHRGSITLAVGRIIFLHIFGQLPVLPKVLS